MSKNLYTICRRPESLLEPKRATQVKVQNVYAPLQIDGAFVGWAIPGQTFIVTQVL